MSCLPACLQEGDLIISVLRSQGFPGAAGIIQVRGLRQRLRH